MTRIVLYSLYFYWSPLPPECQPGFVQKTFIFVRRKWNVLKMSNIVIFQQNMINILLQIYKMQSILKLTGNRM